MLDIGNGKKKRKKKKIFESPSCDAIPDWWQAGDCSEEKELDYMSAMVAFSKVDCTAERYGWGGWTRENETWRRNNWCYTDSMSDVDSIVYRDFLLPTIFMCDLSSVFFHKFVWKVHTHTPKQNWNCAFLSEAVWYSLSASLLILPGLCDVPEEFRVSGSPL